MARRALILVCLGAVTAAAAPTAAQAAPPGPPGPPPGAGTDLPAPPGTAPAFVSAGTPAAIPAQVTGPGLLDGSALAVDRRTRTATLRIACQTGGRVRLTAPALAKGAVAAAPYRCAQNRATLRLELTPTAARRLPRSGATAVTASVKQGGRTTRLSVLIRRGAAPDPGFWTDGNLHCAADAPAGAHQAYLALPDFTARSLTPVSTRSWVAWYTDAAGWHWLGARGEGAGRWDTWTATPTGIAQFHPGGAINPIPWTWGPIAVPTGQGVHAVGVTEIVYWGAGRPTYQWRYVNAGPVGAAAAGGGTPACAYP